MRRFFYFLSCIVIILLLWTGSAASESQAAGLVIPRIYLPLVLNGVPVPVDPPALTLQGFITTVQNGATSAVMGVYVQDVLAQPVVQQPAGDYGFISLGRNNVTQFSLAQTPVVGLIAHNDLAGSYFFKLAIGQDLYLVFGSGRAAHYRVSSIASYQALDPANPASSFVDLADGQTLSAAQLFAQYYLGTDHVTLQTCIAKNGNGSWGRLMLVADPVDVTP